VYEFLVSTYYIFKKNFPKDTLRHLECHTARYQIIIFYRIHKLYNINDIVFGTPKDTILRAWV